MPPANPARFSPATLYTSTKNELVWRSDTSTGFYHNPLGQFDWVVGGGYGFSYVGDDITEERGDTNPWPILRRYVYGPKPDEPIIWYEGSDFSNKRYLVADERGSIVAVTNTSGAAIAINSYDEYGVPGTNNQGRFQYTGQVWVPELGMYSFKARIYSPKYGRFLQTDPAGFPDGPNWYNYANADPVNKADPSGMDAVCTPMADGCIVVSHPALPPINVLQYSQYTAPSFTPGGLSVGPIYTGPTANAAPKTTTPQSAPKPCPAVPSGGPGRDQLNRNIAEARRMGRTFTPGSGPSSALVSGRWFSTKVKSGGDWDYKNQGYSNGQDFGNFNYGATSEALGFDGDISDLFADLYSLLDHGTLEGEDAMIRAGQRYARMGWDSINNELQYIKIHIFIYYYYDVIDIMLIRKKGRDHQQVF